MNDYGFRDARALSEASATAAAECFGTPLAP
jgi:hypothetical protein